jgi:hypothetical protein
MESIGTLFFTLSQIGKPGLTAATARKRKKLNSRKNAKLTAKGREKISRSLRRLPRGEKKAQANRIAAIRAALPAV